jgi:malonyl-CoA/methylmalonyl-CoA synthetase
MHTSAVENALHGLPYISKSIVLAIPDDSYHERVGAIISLKSDTSLHIKPTLKQLREDLEFQTDLPKFKLPTVAYWLKEGEEVPLTQNGKLSKLKARQAFFGPGMENFDQVEVLDLDGVWESGEEKWKAWDWDGIS